MKYIDSGSRDPSQTLAAWLRQVVTDEATELRVQSGYFSADSLGLLLPLLARAQSLNLPTIFVIGANDASTAGEDIERLLALLGMPRSNAKLGIVSYSNALFHPKTFHIKRSDKSQAAFVGSANLTRHGLMQNVEAAIALDTLDNDDEAVLTKIAEAIDRWFDPDRAGLMRISAPAVIQTLVDTGILSACPVASKLNGTATSSSPGTQQAALSPLVGLPAVPGTIAGSSPLPATAIPTAPDPSSSSGSSATSPSGVGSAPASASQPSGNMPFKAVVTFGMTLQNTDVGVGQTTAGTSARSPEVFIPIKALDLSPTFWGWLTPYQPGPTYVADSAWAASHSAWIATEKVKTNRKPRPLDKLDWSPLSASLNGKPITASIWFNPIKKDIRIRESSLRSAGDIDDIMLIQPAPAGSHRNYDIRIIKKTDPNYATVLAKLTYSITNSQKRIGYF